MIKTVLFVTALAWRRAWDEVLVPYSNVELPGNSTVYRRQLTFAAVSSIQSVTAKNANNRKSCFMQTEMDDLQPPPL